MHVKREMGKMQSIRQRARFLTCALILAIVGACGPTDTMQSLDRFSVLPLQSHHPGAVDRYVCLSTWGDSESSDYFYRRNSLDHLSANGVSDPQVVQVDIGRSGRSKIIAVQVESDATLIVSQPEFTGLAVPPRIFEYAGSPPRIVALNQFVREETSTLHDLAACRSRDGRGVIASVTSTRTEPFVTKASTYERSTDGEVRLQSQVTLTHHPLAMTVGVFRKDSTPDICIAVDDGTREGTTGRILLLSQLDGSIVEECAVAAEDEQWFGETLMNAGDLDRDGIDDLVVSASVKGRDHPGKSGRLIALSMVTRQRLWVVDAAHADSNIGATVRNVGDADCDGIPDLGFVDDYSNLAHVVTGATGVVGRLEVSPGPDWRAVDVSSTTRDSEPDCRDLLISYRKVGWTSDAPTELMVLKLRGMWPDVLDSFVVTPSQLLQK